MSLTQRSISAAMLYRYRIKDGRYLQCIYREMINQKGLTQNLENAQVLIIDPSSILGPEPGA